MLIRDFSTLRSCLKEEFLSTKKRSQDFSNWLLYLFLFLSNPCFLSPGGKWNFFNISPAFLPKCISCLGLLYPASSAVPGIGPSLQKPFQEYLEAQRQKLHHKSEMGTPQVRLYLGFSPEQFQAEIRFIALIHIFKQTEWGLLANFPNRSWSTVYFLLGNHLCFKSDKKV